MYRMLGSNLLFFKFDHVAVFRFCVGIRPHFAGQWPDSSGHSTSRMYCKYSGEADRPDKGLLPLDIFVGN
jgi:hypothetical protein